MTEPPSMPPSSSGPDWGEMSGKLKGAQGPDRLLLIASLVFVIATFFPWFSVGPFSHNGWLGVGSVAGIFGILTLVFSVVRVGGVNLNLGELKDGIVFLVLGGLTALLGILRFLLKPSGLGIVKVGWAWGSFIGLAAAIVVGVGAWQKYQTSK